MNLGLKGRIAFVAGASQGLGKAVAMALGHEEAKLAICSTDNFKLSKAVEEIKEKTGCEIIGIPADVSRSEDARNFVRKALEYYGTVDILVNNAGGPPSKQFLEIDDDLWEFGFRLNLLSTIVMTRGVTPAMKEKRWGRIINITSISVKQPIEGLILSNTIRMGVVGFAKSLSNELAPYNVTVNNVCPGYTLTDRVRNLAKVTAEREGTDAEEVIKRWEAQIPMRRLGTPEEFAAVVTFLASELAGYITGASIHIDGGYYKGVM